MPAFIDVPSDEIGSWSFQVVGWVAAPRPGAPARLEVSGRKLTPVLYQNAELKAALPAFAYTARVFANVNLLDILRPADAAASPQPVRITLGIGEDVVSRDVSLADTLWRALPEQMAIRRASRAWCADRLRCPVCRDSGARMAIGPDMVTCRGCGAAFPQRGAELDMLPPALRQAADLTPATSVSSNPYEALAAELIQQTTASGGWVLDCGAGSRPARMPQVVNVEIEDYFSTDVLAVGEALPFQDGVFDAALSLAVLEHVRDPFACARELVRVVKPGGEIICSVPFLQPVHGYPDHYYNMTRNGLINLFRGHAEVADCLTPPNGHPLFAVQWILREYLEGLPQPERDQFGAMTMAQAAAIDPARMLADSIATRLSEGAMATIACLNTVRLRVPASRGNARSGARP